MSSDPGHAFSAGYASAELGVAACELMVRVGLLAFYTERVGLSPLLAGVAIVIGVLWDAVTDPLIGALSDRHWRGMPARLPLMMLGAPGLAASVVALFNPPELTSPAAALAYLIVTYLAFNTFMTLLAVPHHALPADLAREESGRLRLFGWRLFGANLGLLVAAALPAGLAWRVEPHEVEPVTSLWIGGLVLVSAMLCTAVVRRRLTPGARGATASPEPGPISVEGHLGRLRGLWQHRAFRGLLGAYLVANLGLNLNTALALYYYRYRLGLEEAETRAVVAVFLIAFCASIPLWCWLARHGTRQGLLASGIGALGVATSVVYPLFPAGAVGGPLVMAVVGGGLVGSVVLLDLAVAQLADRSSGGAPSVTLPYGLYFGVWRMTSKLARALAVLAAGIALQVMLPAGGAATATMEHGESLGLALIFGPGVGVLLVVAALMVRRVRL